MKEIKRISIIGLGAIGGAYASRLYEVNPDIMVIADKERIERYSKQGFLINNKKYNFNYISPDKEVEPADLIIVAVKYNQLDQAIMDMKNHVGKETIILSLMNGIDSEEKIAEVYGYERILYGMCVAIDAQREGCNISYTNIGKIFFGDKENYELTPRVKRLKDLFHKANIPYVIPENMLKSLWWKFMINVGINQVSAVLRAPYRVFQEINEARELMVSTMMEVIILSKKLGINLEEKDIDEFILLMMTLDPNGKTSMHQDIDAGRKTEVEMLSGVVCKLGAKYGVSTPLNDSLYKMIKTIEKIN